MTTKKVAAALACALVLGLPCIAVAAGSSSSVDGSDKPAVEKSVDGEKTAASQKSDGEVSGDKTANGKTAADAPADQDADAAAVAAPSEELLAWAEGMTCEACHADQAASADDEKCTMSVHAPLDLVCTTCHIDDALIDVHSDAKADAKLPTKLKKTEVAGSCVTCHDVDALAEATADSQVLTDSEGNVANPHDLPDVKEHEGVTCDNCHRMHSESSLKTKASDVCVSCHHEDVYECYTCHV